MKIAHNFIASPFLMYQPTQRIIMEQFKQFVIYNFERILVGVILVAAFVGTYVIEEKSFKCQILRLFKNPEKSQAFQKNKSMELKTLFSFQDIDF
jgi:hypothetical protein